MMCTRVRSWLGRQYLFFLRGLFRPIPNVGVKIMEESWDCLIILDACRYDVFKRINDISGKLYKKRSLGSDTREWAVNNFRQLYPNVVYFSANPLVSRCMMNKLIGRQPFYDIVDIWDFGWDNILKTVLPEKVNEVVLENKERYRGKKKLIHYIQPHYPFLCDPDLSFGGPIFYSDDLPKEMKNRIKNDNVPIWNLVRSKVIPVERVKRAYEKNLKVVLEKTKELIEELEGKIIITADHGNCFGEWNIYGHLAGIHLKQLVEIPWLEVTRA